VHNKAIEHQVLTKNQEKQEMLREKQILKQQIEAHHEMLKNRDK
jgi:hypothetical protein